MAYKVIILYRLYMPSYFLGTFTEYPSLNTILAIAIMFVFCNGKIILFTEINNSKRGYLFGQPLYLFVIFYFFKELDVHNRERLSA